MNPELLVALGKIAGIAGITVGALVLIFRSIIQKSFLSQMTQEQSFKTTNKIITFAGLLAVIGIGSWVYLKASGNADDKSKIVIKGIVKDYENNTIQNLKVTLKSGSVLLANGITDSEGNFSVTDKGAGAAEAMLEIAGQGYVPYTRNIEFNYSEKIKDIGEVKLKSQNSEENKPIVNPPSQATSNSQTSNQTGLLVNEGNNFNSASSDFVIINTGEYGSLLSSLGATADANLTIGGMSYTLNNTDLKVPFSQAGMIDYQITGYTYLNGQMTCTNNSIGKIELAAGAKYYVFENLANTASTDCNWYLFNENQFMQQKTVLQQRIVQTFQGW